MRRPRIAARSISYSSAANGDFLLFVYNEQIEPEGDEREVTVTFGTAPKRVTEYRDQAKTPASTSRC